MGALLREKLGEVLRAVAPLVLVIALLQVTVVHAPAAVFLQFLGGAALSVVGMMLLFVGVDLGILPMGRFIGAELPRRGSLWLILGAAFGLGFATTVAEPDVLVLARQVDVASAGAIPRARVVYVTALGLALFVAVAMWRVVRGFPAKHLLAGAYGLVIALSVLAPSGIVPLAFDAGSVTTGALTTPVVIALALGVSSVLAGRSALTDGFGLLGFASIGPIVAILLLGLLGG